MDNEITEIRKLIESGRLDKAELALSGLLKQNPDSHELLNLQAELNLKLGSIYWENGDIEKALEYLTKALEMNPFDRNTVLKCGEVLSVLEQYNTAKKLYSSYFKKNPDDKEISQAIQKLYSHRKPIRIEDSELVQRPEKKSAIIFASYIDNDESLKLGYIFLDVFKKKCFDCDIFIGINPCTKQDEWIKAIKESDLKITYAITPPDLVINSDSSAFQTALRLLKESNEQYDFVWFGHTKGVTSRRYDIALHYINNFFLRRYEIEKILINEEYGTYGLECVLHPETISDRISQYREYLHKQLQIMYLYAFYVIKGNIVYDFIHNCSSDFFTEKIKGDRYFFERDFYQIVFMQGYLPYAENVVQLNFLNWGQVISNRETFNSRVKEWQKVELSNTLNKQIKVSAIVSSYNSESFIRGCLEDLVNQSLYQKGELEIIVVDSGSQQNEKVIVEEFQERYKNIVYIRTEERETIYEAWNRGIKVASGKCITNANTDDRHCHDAFEIMAKELDENPEVALVYGDVFVTNFPCESFANHIRCGYHIRPDYSPDIMLSGCHMGPQPMWRKSVHGEIGYFNPLFKSAGDYEMWCRIAMRYQMKHIQEFFGVYYENPEGFCNIDKELSFRETAMIQQMYRSQFPHPKPLSEYINNYQFMEYVSPHKYVNICMVTYNRLNFTRQAIDGLIKFTRYPHVITVVDNNSQDSTKEYLQELHRKGIIKNLILLNENVGVAKASNLAWHMGPDAEYYLKFDNDIVIQKPDWLDGMVRVIEAIPVIGVLGYNFEPFSYPIVNVNGYKIRPKKANIGGACCLIPKRTSKRLGSWFEDYGLYSEEDADYGLRIQLAGLMNAYMEDEGIGIHLPAGKAAFINPYSLTAEDGVEEIEDVSYRQWKDEQRRKVVCSHTFNNQMNGYINGTIPLYVESRFAKEFIRERNS